MTHPRPKILTDPAVIRQRCLNQPKISLAKARRSVQAGISMGTRDRNGQTLQEHRPQLPPPPSP